MDININTAGIADLTSNDKVLTLSQIIALTGLSMSRFAKICGINPPKLSEICTKGEWPKSKRRQELAQRISDELKIYNVFVSPENLLQTAIVAQANVVHKTKEKNDMIITSTPLNHSAMMKFGFKQSPFTSVLSSINDVYYPKNVNSVVKRMLETAKSGGFLAVIGESGSGKTTSLIYLEDMSTSQKLDINVIRPSALGMERSDKMSRKFKTTHMVEAIISSISPESKMSNSIEIRDMQVKRMLMSSFNTGRRHVIVIDEAHSLNNHILRQLKRFREIQIGFQNVLGVILLAQPELRDRLNETNVDLREIIQRIEIIDLVTITPPDLRNYLDHRLANYHKKSNDLIDDDGVIAFVELLSKQGANRGAAEHDFLTPLNIGQSHESLS